MQAWPAFAMLKASNPELKLTALVPNYTAPLAEICPFIDDVYY
ncbi:ADP-heptose--lipooligosaccharide heptosyltransferase III [Haemophilus influenzae]|uniref:ADP-heptose--lipooligosaccharide heptosyltransferase III n=1 Tax=Haemophilus influenzae TaxID=727 RepID=A0A2X1PMR3_HAEIF|nr:ADP-heptose--lipooligosaccharide heptosyltransferase III [Haemophilus influenzae]